MVQHQNFELKDFTLGFELQCMKNKVALKWHQFHVKRWGSPLKEILFVFYEPFLMLGSNLEFGSKAI